MASLKSRRSSAFLMASILAPMQFDAVLFENAGFGQFDRKIQSGLAADGRQQAHRDVPCESLR